MNRLIFFKNHLLKILYLGFLVHGHVLAQRMDTVGYGWAKTSVNATVFRKNSVVSSRGVQYTAYYDSSGFMVIAKRAEGTHHWDIKRTAYTGNVADAHNVISIMADGAGYLHVAWDHHNHPLHYSRSVAPGSLDLTPMIPMTGEQESDVTYPEFHRLPSGNLIFLYRGGASGNGNLIVNHYDIKTQKWKRLHTNLIDGETQRNAYWQTFIDHKGIIHISWVWRETWDVSTNHDMAYACSKDEGRTWQKASGEQYILPINQDNAAYALKIPQNSELINQTSMYADSKGHPYIATYWRPEGTTVPQYFIIWHDGKRWQKQQAGQRTSPFSLKGAGTKKIPISRPQLMIQEIGNKTKALLIFRDAERGSRVSIAQGDLATGKWSYTDLTTKSVGDWEPSYDTELWKQKQVLNLFVQRVGQGDGEKMDALPPQPVMIMEWKP